MSLKIGFFVRHFTERGTEVALYDYAKFNEDILGNKSYIICFTQNYQKVINFPLDRTSYNKFLERFEIIEIDGIQEIKKIQNNIKIDFFYTLTGGGSDIYNFKDKEIWQNIKTIKHCVFDHSVLDADYNLTISNFLNIKYNTNLPVIPHIVSLPCNMDNLRDELKIPKDAIVLGRYGGFSEFNIPYVKNAIIKSLHQKENLFFLFMNTEKFYDHPRVIHLKLNVNMDHKVKFINTCDAMIHARSMGETFGCSIAEFSIKNKPIITNGILGDKEHLMILKDKALIYNNENELEEIFKNIETLIKSKENWNAYEYYSAENIMKLFQIYIFDN